MKGPKIEDLRDPKWLGKKIIKSSDEDEWMKVLYQGTHECFVVDNRNMEGNAPYKFHYWDAHNPFDWHEWIEEEKKPEFPFKIGDTIRHKSWIEKNSRLEILAINGPFVDYSKNKYFEIDGVLDRDIIVPIAKKTNHYAPGIVNTTYRIATTDYKDWELYVEDNFKFPFNVGDNIKHKTFTRNIYVEILEISEPAYLKDFKIFVKKHNYFNAEKTEHETYYISAKEFKNWELWKNPYPPEPKKKKTILFDLKKSEFLLQEDLPKFTMYSLHGYDSESVAADLIRRDPNTIQFPAVTKDGIVLEFEVDDE